MRISEPMTMATDYLLTAVALVLGLRLLAVRESPPARLWGLAFLTAAIAAAVGGTRHGFAPMLDPGTIGALRRATLLAVGVASFLMLSGAALASLTGGARRGLLIVNAVKLAAYLGWTATHDDFRYAVFDHVAAMGLVLALQVKDSAAGRRAAPRWIVPGLLVSFAAALLQRLGVGFHEHFNHNDLYHVLECGALYLQYRGGLALRPAG